MVLVHPNAEKFAETLVLKSGLEKRAEVRTTNPFLPLTVWAEDAYAAVDDGKGGTWLIEPFVFTRNGDALIADNVSSFTDVRNAQTPLVFQGGNILAGDDFWFLGMDYIADTVLLALGRYRGVGARPPLELPKDLPTDPAQRQQVLLAFAEAMLSKYLDSKRKLIPIASSLEIPRPVERKIKVDGEEWSETIFDGAGNYQPIFHIDMFLSLAGRNQEGKYRVLVGSPQQAAKLLGVPSPQHAMDDIFDDIAAQLKNASFDVVRNPLPLVAYDIPAAKQRRWEWATSNNCWVEITETKHRVYLPTYGYEAFKALKATDDEMVRIWNSLGFEVVQFGDFHPFTIAQGAAHCMKKYLGRSTDGAVSARAE